MAAGHDTPHRAPRHIAARRRALTSAAVGVTLGTALAFVTSWQLALMAGWDVTAVVLLARVWSQVGRLDPDQTRHLATAEDNSRSSTALLLLSASTASLIGAGAGLLEAKQSGSPMNVMLTAASLITVSLSWLVVHTMFTLRYAHEYYSTPVGGFDFKMGNAEPDYRDFAYVAFTIGMAFQVSETDVTNRFVRRTVLRHSFLAYLFGAVIVAVMVNVTASLL
jgi:uncharacterized membrane protein